MLAIYGRKTCFRKSRLGGESGVVDIPLMYFCVFLVSLRLRWVGFCSLYFS